MQNKEVLFSQKLMYLLQTLHFRKFKLIMAADGTAK